MVFEFTVICQLPYSFDTPKIKNKIERLLLEMSGVAIRNSSMGRFRPKMDAVKVFYLIFIFNFYFNNL